MKDKKNIVIVMLVAVCIFLCGIIAGIGLKKSNTKEYTSTTQKSLQKVENTSTTQNVTENIDNAVKESLSDKIDESTKAFVSDSVSENFDVELTTKFTTDKPSYNTTKKTTTKSTTNKPDTTKSTTIKTTSTLQTTNDDATRRWFVVQYDIAKEQYINGLEKEITSFERELDSVESAASDLYVNYMAEVRRIKENYPPSGTREAMLRNAEQNYNRQATEYTETRKVLEDDIRTLENEISNPKVDKILAIVTSNCGITSKEAYEYYYLYIA